MSGRLILERTVALDAVTRASEVCISVFRNLVSVESVAKKDKSPVTVADFSAQAVVNLILHATFPSDPIVGEEDANELRGDSAQAALLREKVVELTNSVLDVNKPTDEILSAIDLGRYAGGPRGRHWTVDPIDGTKGFLRGEQFAVCLALIIDGQVELGVMGCPNLPMDPSKPDGERGCLFVAVRGEGAFQRLFSSPNERQIIVSSVSDTSEAVFCESVDADHSCHEDAARIAAALGIRKPPVRMDSQCKYGTLSRAAADIYLRLPVQKDYDEKIWDHATGSLLVHEAGGVVTDVMGRPLDFSLGRTLKANVGVVATSRLLHPRVLDAVQSVRRTRQSVDGCRTRHCGTERRSR